MDIIKWIIENQEAVFTTILAAHGLALAIVNLTPTPSDDKVVAKVYKWVERLAGVFGKAKQ